MADDNGIIADLELAIATSLAAITLSSNKVFRTVDVWRFQIASPDDFKRYAPFAFVEYDGDGRSRWEGDHDLNVKLVFAIRVGIESSKKKEGARIGTGTNAQKRQLGFSRLRDLIITDLQAKRLTTTDNKQESMEYVGSEPVWSEPNRFAAIMRFAIYRVDSYPPS